MANLLKKSLHICSMETYDLDRFRYSCCYSVQAISFTELLSFSSTPIIISFSRYHPQKQLASSQDEFHVLREVDSLEGKGVPHRMRFCVFRSHIVLAGGEVYCFQPTTKVYVMETNPNLSSSGNLQNKSKRARARAGRDDSDGQSHGQSRQSNLQNISKRARARARARAVRAKASDDNPELQSEKAKAKPKAKASDEYPIPQPKPKPKPKPSFSRATAKIHLNQHSIYLQLQSRARDMARAVRAKASDDNPELQSEKAKAKASDEYPELQSEKAKAKAKASDDSFSVPQFRSEKCNPKLMEIQGKLYVIDISPPELRKFAKADVYAFFEVFDPQTGAWASLPHPPAPVLNGSDICLAVLGTNIFIQSNDSPFYSFDVAKPTLPWKEVLLRYVIDDQLERGKLPLGSTLEVDLEEDNSKLLFYIQGRFIRVIRMNLLMSNRLLVLEDIATMQLDAKFDAFRSSFTHLGGLKLCLVLRDDSAPRGGPVYTLSGVIFTFEISLSKSAATSPDPYFRIIPASNGTSFSAKTLGWRPFEYHWHDQKVYPSLTQVIGLAVLPLSHQEHALCRSCRTYFVNTEYLSRHLSIDATCRLGQPVIQCKYCRFHFPKQELSAHFNTSMSCKSKFTYSSKHRDEEIKELLPSC